MLKDTWKSVLTTTLILTTIIFVLIILFVNIDRTISTLIMGYIGTFILCFIVLVTLLAILKQVKAYRVADNIERILIISFGVLALLYVVFNIKNLFQ